MYNKALFLSLFYIFGIIAYLYEQTFIIQLILLLFIFYLAYKKTFSKVFLIILYLFFFLAILNCKFHIKNYDDLSFFAPQENITVRGQISSIPVLNDKNMPTQFYLNVNSITVNNIKYDNVKARTYVFILKQNKFFKIGDSIEIQGNLQRPSKSKNPSQFDYGQYLKTKNTYSIIYTKDIKLVNDKNIVSVKWKFLQNINDLRIYFINKHSQYISGANLELLGGVIFGDDAIKPRNELKTSFVNSGLAHLLAASGLNVGLIFALFMFFAGIFKVSTKVSLPISMGIIALYVCMTGFPASIVRAAIMIEFVILGKVIDRNSNNVSVLFFASLLMLIYNPLFIIDVSFQLSFLVTFGLIISTQPIMSVAKNIPVLISADIFAPIISQLWVMPLQMFYFNSFTLYSFFANILVIPIIMIVSFLGFLSLFLAIFPYISDKLIQICDFVLNPLISIIIYIADFFSNLPYSHIDTYKPFIFQIVIYYLILLTFVLVLKQKFKNKKTIIAFIILLSVLFISYIKIPKNNLEIIAFSVKYSDLFLIKTPENKYILIESGSKTKYGKSLASIVLMEYLKDHNIKNIEVFIVTNNNSDLYNRSLDIFKNVNVKKVIVQNYVQKTSLNRNIVKYFKDNNVNFDFVKNNDLIYKENNFEIFTYFDHKNLNINKMESSIITYIKYKNFKALFMGDAGIKAFNNIDKYLPTNINLLKLGHLRAKYSINEKYLKYLNPKFVIITDEGNSYNQPNYLILKLLNSKESTKVLRTDYDNAIKIEYTNDEKENIYRYSSKKRNFELLE